MSGTKHLIHLNETVVFSDIHVESKCFAPSTDLHLNCDSPSNSAIYIEWNATFFGLSRPTCSNSTCCPGDTDCTVLVTESEHFEGPHWDELTACNGQTTCSVQVVHTASGCSPATDYETVTYQCIIQQTSSTASTLDPTTYGQTERWTNTGRDQTTSQETVYTGVYKAANKFMSK